MAKKISDHSKRLDQIQRDLEAAVGAKTSSNRQRYLTQGRKLMMGALQRDEGLADFVKLEVPVCDLEPVHHVRRVRQGCTTHAIDVDKRGNVTVKSAYCVSCGACVTVCEDGALVMEPMDVRELVVPDKLARGGQAQEGAGKAQAEEYKELGKQQLRGGRRPGAARRRLRPDRGGPEQ